jgi:hypothetical protein
VPSQTLICISVAIGKNAKISFQLMVYNLLEAGSHENPDY